MQTYNVINNELTGAELPGKVYENMQSLKSDFSGTEFPTTNLVAGMTVFRTDQNKVYRLLSDLQTWRLESDLSVEGGLSAKATNDANGKEITSYIAKLEKDTNDDSIINIYNGADTKVGSITVATSMVGATTNSNGKAGNVPQPKAGDQDKVLHGDGSWRKAVGFESYWEPNETVQAGEVRFPTGRDNSGIVLECVQTGTTGSSQPAIPNVVGMGLTAQDIQTLLTAIEQVQSTNGQTADKITGISDYIIESYRNGTEWYEVYKSGKVRQGGRSNNVKEWRTITLRLPMADTSYNIQVTTEGYQGDLRSAAAGSVSDRTTTTFPCACINTSNRYSEQLIDWVVEGQGA